MKAIFGNSDGTIFDQIAQFFIDIVDAIRDFFNNLFGNDN